MFAMLTGNLPFTVEPFNIKQLHQKMINGEIGSIPSDISKGEAARAAEPHENLIFLRAQLRAEFQSARVCKWKLKD